MKLFGTTNEILAPRGAELVRCWAGWVLLAGSVSCAGAMQSPNVTSPPHRPRARTEPPHPVLADGLGLGTQSASGAKKAPVPPAKAEPAPAKVALERGILTIEAENSDLEEILKAVAGLSGMAIDGEIKSSRVYGVYGPGSPRGVLTDLLAGSGYNFMMVGVTDEGVPRELLLSTEKGKSPPSSPAPASAVAANIREVPDAGEREEEQLGPGVIAHVPPPPSQDPEERVQQNLQRLKQMREHMKEQNVPQ